MYVYLGWNIIKLLFYNDLVLLLSPICLRNNSSINLAIVSYVSLQLAAWTIEIDDFVFPLCRRRTLTLSFEESAPFFWVLWLFHFLKMTLDLMTITKLIFFCILCMCWHTPSLLTLLLGSSRFHCCNLIAGNSAFDLHNGKYLNGSGSSAWIIKYGLFSQSTNLSDLDFSLSLFWCIVKLLEVSEWVWSLLTGGVGTGKSFERGIGVVTDRTSAYVVLIIFIFLIKTKSFF